MATSETEIYPVLMYLNKHQENLIRVIFERNHWTLSLKVLTKGHLEKLESFDRNKTIALVPTFLELVGSRNSSQYRPPGEEYDNVYNKQSEEMRRVDDYNSRGIAVSSNSYEQNKSLTDHNKKQYIYEQNKEFIDHNKRQHVDEQNKGLTDCNKRQHIYEQNKEFTNHNKRQHTDEQNKGLTNCNKRQHIYEPNKEVSDLNKRHIILDQRQEVLEQNNVVGKITGSNLEENSHSRHHATERMIEVKTEVFGSNSDIENEDSSTTLSASPVISEKTDTCDSYEVNEAVLLDDENIITKLKSNTEPPAQRRRSTRLGVLQQDKRNDKVDVDQTSVQIGPSGPDEVNSGVTEVRTFMKYLHDNKAKYPDKSDNTRPHISGQLMQICCHFLLEKDQGFSEWSQYFISLNHESGGCDPLWKTKITEMAKSCDESLMEVIVKRLKDILRSSEHGLFTDYFSNFLLTAKSLMDKFSMGQPEISLKGVLEQLDSNSSEQNVVSVPDTNWHKIDSPTTNDKPETNSEDLKQVKEKINWKLSRHSHRFPGLLSVSCLYCPKKFYNQKNLRFHTQKAHPEHAEIHKCFTCKKQFLFKRNLINHGRKEKHKTHSVMCEKCGRDLSSENALQMHMKSVHRAEKTHFCDLCDKSFKQHSSLQTHKKSCHSDEVSTCDICGRSFTCRRYMLEHRLRHNEENKRYKCPDCDKTFYTKHNVTIHHRVHTGEKPFKCPLCDYHCAFKNNIGKHMKIHKEHKQ